jgi:hypothetical protein
MAVSLITVHFTRLAGEHWGGWTTGLEDPHYELICSDSLNHEQHVMSIRMNTTIGATVINEAHLSLIRSLESNWMNVPYKLTQSLPLVSIQTGRKLLDTDSWGNAGRMQAVIEANIACAPTEVVRLIVLYSIVLDHTDNVFELAADPFLRVLKVPWR